MKRLAAAAVMLAFVGLVIPVRAADNPTGTWKWTTEFGGQTRESTLKLKLDGDKLTGVYVGGQSNTETPIEDATIKGDLISFKVTRERNGQKSTTKYNGKLSGDTITGKSERDRDGKATSTDWVAKRQK
jgi:hypothetical protein